MNHDAHALPDVAWADGSTPQEYTSLILEQLAEALIPPPVETTADNVAEALALTRQWRKTLPEQGHRREMYGRFAPRDLLRIAARHILTADDIAAHSSEPHPIARPLRYAEAALRTWLKGQTP